MIKLKDKKINSVYLGNKKINSVYLGNQKVYSSLITKYLNLKSKNLFDKDNANIVDALINNYTMTPSAVIKSLYIRCKPNTTYTVSKILSARLIVATSNIKVTRNSDTISQRIQENDATSITLTTDANANYLVLQYYHADYDTLTEQEILNTVQIEEGTTATDFVPYYDYTLMKDDYITEDCVIHHKRKKVVFDGSESWGASSFAGNYRTQLTIEDAKISTTSTLIAKCNSFYYSNEVFNSALAKLGQFGKSNSTKTFYFMTDKTLSNFKTWLTEQYTNNTPVILEYELETEETETIPNNIPLYNQIKEIYSVIGSGTITVENLPENAPLIVENSTLKGNTIQNSYSGKNLLNAPIPYNTNASGTTNTKFYNIPNLELNKTYFVYGECSDGTILEASNSAFVLRNNQLGQLKNVGFNRSFTNDVDMSNVDDVLIYTNSILAGKTISKIMVSEGSTATSYEPYTNGPAPNPSYPQIIKNVREDNTINII